MSTDYGTDVSTFVSGDLDKNFRLISGPRVVAEGVCRRWLSKRGSLRTNPNIGLDIRDMLSNKFDDSESSLFGLRSAMTREALLDERVDDVSLDFKYDSAVASLRITAVLQLSSSETYQFVLAISAIDVSFFELGVTL